jgi:hypothetical protein
MFAHNPIYNSHYFLYDIYNNPWKEDSLSWVEMKKQLTQLVKEEEE